MLVLTRKVGETIVISENILITVVRVEGEKVRIGIAAPPHIVVNRQEVHDRSRVGHETQVFLDDQPSQV